MLRELPIPPHFNPSKADSIWRVPYQERASEALEWLMKHSITASETDDFRVCLILIDVQNTFCMPGFELFVAGRTGRGAVEDCQRIASFIYRNLASITRIVATMDTHQAYQIFHSVFFEDEDGNHPTPYTRITVDDVKSGRWRVSKEAARTIGISHDYLKAYVRHYVETLEKGGKYELTIWPYHAMLGGIGHALVPIVEEAVFFHSIARSSQPLIRTKGFSPLTEHYSALGPEVKRGPGGEVIGERDEQLINHLLTYDALIVAGEAKSHCVAWTVSDLIEALKERAPSLVSRIYLLEDCTSPVVVPGVVDYSTEADLAYKRFEAEGARIVKSTQPMNFWPGMQG
ncbi:MAG: isochorismatase [Nitrososphaerota archaeon]|nr:isochorismatase [Candidatus Calditenuaceae archaeon]MDW8073268.1 isochorismatase [Nitrososphaerota archaeon]